MFQCCNPAENAIFCAIQVYLPCVYGNRKSQPGNTLLAIPLPLVDDSSNTIACPV